MKTVNILGYIGSVRHNAWNNHWWINFETRIHYHFHIVNCITYCLRGPKYKETNLTTLALRLGFKVYDGCFPEFTCEEDLIKFVKYIQNPLIRFQNV